MADAVWPESHGWRDRRLPLGTPRQREPRPRCHGRKLPRGHRATHLRADLLSTHGTDLCGCDLMRELAFQADHLGKQYKIGLSGQHHTTLRDQLMACAKAIVRRKGHPQLGSSTIWALRDVSFEIKRWELVG